ncbi:hypothetical protein AB0F13_19815 [Streptomyces sp. NPDC026206]|uniref:hypothetical protein n=1 Tax=Streptomyces sp. NPDC026206 TaxID=3157089 RepID=UPI0033CE0849
MIELGKIPTFTGNLEHLETHAASLKTTASNIRTTGKDVHNAFQALDAVYDAPEERELLDSTIPVRDKADEFAKKLESVGGTLASFASTARPLVQKMKQLRADAEKFVADNKHDDDWQKDQKKVDENARLVREVGTTWVAFQGVERDAANKITGLISGGTHFVVDDGSHKAGMYGFKESDVKDAKETPWGTVDKREYTGWRAAWEWTKDNVGGALKGFFVDGVWGTLKGLGSMVNVFDWDNFKKTWSSIGMVFGGVSAYIMTPFEWGLSKIFGPVDDNDSERQKAALRNFGKSLVAWDEWGKDPARAVGTVLFNGLTLGSGSLLKLGKAGQAGKLGAGAEALTALGKAGALVDPMSYLGKAAGVTKLKVGDFMEGLKASRAGVDDMAKNIPTGTSPHPAEVPATPGHSGEPASTPSHSGAGSSTPAHSGDGAAHSAGSGEKTPPGREYVDHAGNKRVIGDDGYIRDEHGNVVPDTEPVREPHKDDLPDVKEGETAPAKEHETAPVKEEAKVLEGAGGPSHVENAAGHPSDGAHPTGGGSGTHNTPSTGGHAADHPTGGGSGSGAGTHTPSGSGGGSHTPSGGGGHGTGGHGDTPGTGAGASDHGGSDGHGGSGGHGETPGTGAGGHAGEGHGAGSGHGGDSGSGAGSGDDGGAGSGSGDHTPPGTYKPGPDGEVPNLKRHDDDFSNTHNSKGQRKSYINADGDLVPANPNGDATIPDHIVGRDPHKSDSPYTSLSKDGANAKDYGGMKIQIDLPRLVDDIAKGKLKNVEVYSPKEVEAAIQKSADEIAGRPVDIDVPPDTPKPEIAEMAKKFGLSKTKTKRIAQRMADMMHTRRDSEWLIKGVVPRDYISGP